jgi:hypothetical protein
MQVTYHRSIGNPLADKLWAIYERGFSKFDESTIFSQMCDEAEFRWMLSAPTGYAVVVWGDVEPVGFAGFQRSLKGSQYFNESYVQARYPDQYARQQVHYCWSLCVDDSADERSAYQAVVKASAALAMRDGSIMLFDVPDGVDDALPTAAKVFYRVAATVGEGTLEEIGRQRMFALVPASQEVNESVLPDIVDLRGSAAVIDLAERKASAGRKPLEAKDAVK